MPIRHWSEQDFQTDLERAQHRTRSREHWREAVNCWFWLRGPGADEPGWFFEADRKWWAPEERRKAEIDRRSNGWNLDTLDAVKRYQDQLRMDRQNFRPAPDPRPSGPARRARSTKLSGSTLDDSPTSAPGAMWIPPPTIERDWPAVETYTAGDRARIMAQAMGRASGAFGRQFVDDARAVLTAEQPPVKQAEVLYDGDDQGNAYAPKPEPEPEDDWWPQEVNP